MLESVTIGVGSTSDSLPLREGEDEVEATFTRDYGILAVTNHTSDVVTHLIGHP